MAEKCFWNAVKTDRFMGLHFRRQQIIHGFIADFYCEELNVVVEVDGGIHEEQKDYDLTRPIGFPLRNAFGEGSRVRLTYGLSVSPTKKSLIKAIGYYPKSKSIYKNI